MKLASYVGALTLVMATALPSLADYGRDQDSGRRGPPVGREDGRAQRITLNLYDEVFVDRNNDDRGRNDRRGASGASELKLKVLLKQQHPYLDVENMDLVEVNMIAKSALGNGQAELVLDGRNVDRQQVGLFLDRERDPRDAFDRGGSRTFDQVQLSAARSGSDARTWQIDLTGVIKVRTIEIVLKTNRRGGHDDGGHHDDDRYGRVRQVHLGSMRPEQFLIDAKEFRVQERGEIVVVTLAGLRRETQVESVEVQYRRGPSEYLYELSGYLDKGRSKTARLRSRGEVRAIIVRASSVRLFKGEGEIQVSVGVRR